MPLKYHLRKPRSFLPHGFVASITLVTVFFITRNPVSTPSSPFHNHNPIEKHPARNTLNTSHNQCLSFIFYDKPVKTGSTSVEKALLDYIDSLGEQPAVCGTMLDCAAVSEQICLGVRSPGHLVHHLRINSSRVHCLHNKGYYHVTSIREPKARILSAFKYNRASGRTFNGIDSNAPFEVFLEKYPRCGLFNYYDGLGARCDPDEDVEAIKKRAESIVNRMDEIIELTEEPISDLHARIDKYIRNRNVVPLEVSNATEFEVPYETAKAEYVLYNMMKEKRESLAQNPRRILCERQIGDGVKR